MEAGNLNPNSKTDNTIDSSDSPIFEDTEVSEHIYFGHYCVDDRELSVFGREK